MMQYNLEVEDARREEKTKEIYGNSYAPEGQLSIKENQQQHSSGKRQTRQFPPHD
jgi:hypothetical protein